MEGRPALALAAGAFTGETTAQQIVVDGTVDARVLRIGRVLRAHEREEARSLDDRASCQLRKLLQIDITSGNDSYDLAVSRTPRHGCRDSARRSAFHNHAIALSSKAVHPNAAKAFLDYFYSDESLKIMAKFGEFMTRKGIYPPLPDADKIQVVPMDEPDAAAMGEKRKEYRKIFYQ
jgi:hypothetical protein